MRRPDLVELDGIDLGSALEQRLFFALRDGPKAEGAVSTAMAGPAGLAQLMAASGASVLSRFAPRPGDDRIIALVREPTHYPVLARIDQELRRLGSASLVMLRVGRAASVAPPGQGAPRLSTRLDPFLVPALGAFHARVAARLRSATAAWPEELRHVAGRELPRIALGAGALASVVIRWRPALLVAHDEVGTWARLLPAVGRRHGVPTLDLPHAEAADPVAMSGAGYDRMAVYGPRAAAFLGQAGVAQDRVVEIGAPRFDALLEGGLPPVRAVTDDAERRRIVFAAQYVTGAMTPSILAECWLAALAVAGAAAPSELIVVPHPADSNSVATGPMRATPPSGVTVRVAREEGLHDVLPGSWAMVTGWSNSVFEAALAGVPSITVNPDGTAPVAFAAEGLSLEAGGTESAAGVARLLLDEEARGAAVARAREALPAHIGPLDGRASERAARLMLETAGPRAPVR
jgi:hypothetical protein